MYDSNHRLEIYKVLQCRKCEHDRNNLKISIPDMDFRKLANKFQRGARKYSIFIAITIGNEKSVSMYSLNTDKQFL